VTEGTLIALVNGVFSVIIIVLGARLSTKVKAVRNQVENGHTTNMREEGDERHEESIRKLDELIGIVEPMKKDIRGLRESVSRLWQRADSNREKIHQLELTNPPKQTRSDHE